MSPACQSVVLYYGCLDGGGAHKRKSAMHRSRNRLIQQGGFLTACAMGRNGFARVHGGESHLEHLSANPNGQQQQHKACGDQVGEHGSAHFRHVLWASDVDPKPDGNDEKADGKESGYGLHVFSYVDFFNSDRHHLKKRSSGMMCFAPFSWRTWMPSGFCSALMRSVCGFVVFMVWMLA